MNPLDRLIEKATPAGIGDILTANVAATERLAAAIDRLAAATEAANEAAGVSA